MPAIPLTLTGKFPTQRKKRLYSGMQAKRQVGGGLDNATENALTGAIASALTNLSYERPPGTVVGRNRPLSRGGEYKIVGGDEDRASPTSIHAESEGGEPAAKIARSLSIPQDSASDVAVKDPMQLREQVQPMQPLQAGRTSAHPAQAQFMQMHQQHPHQGYLPHTGMPMPIQFPMHPHAFPSHFMQQGHAPQFAMAGYPPHFQMPMQMYGMPRQGAFHPAGFVLPNGQFVPHVMAYSPAAVESRSAPVASQLVTTAAPTTASTSAVPTAAPIASPSAATTTQVQEQVSVPAAAVGDDNVNTHIAAIQAQAQRAVPVRPSAAPSNPPASSSASAVGMSSVLPIPSGQLPAQYWAGVLYYDAVRCLQVWKGSWVNLAAAQAGQKPSPELLARSASQFEYTSEVVQRSLAVAADGSLQPQSGFLRGTYRMVSELTGKFETFTDREFFIEYEYMAELGGDTKRYAVYGSGDCQFGAFVVTGSFNTLSSVMELTRQYISV